jgi:hypothetical protein
MLTARAGISNITFFCPNNMTGCRRQIMEPTTDKLNVNQSLHIRKKMFIPRRVNTRIANLAESVDIPKSMKKMASML